MITNEDTDVGITLTGFDIEGDALTYVIVSQPSHGILTGVVPNIAYTPTANYNGADLFTFKVNDGYADSAPATVSITVTAVNDAPTANAQSITTNEDTAKSITLSGSDIDGSPLTYVIVVNPSHGVLSGTGSSRTYTPTANYNGADSFTFKVNDGTVDSAPAKVSITVKAVNDAPSCGTITPVSGSSIANQSVSFTTVYSDPDGWQNIKYTYLLVNKTTSKVVSGLNCCYVYYDISTNKLYLRNDADSAWLGGYIPGSAKTIENSYVKINCASTVVSGTSSTLRVKWNITFKPTYKGTKNTYLYVKDIANAFAGWKKVGTWIIQ